MTSQPAGTIAYAAVRQPDTHRLRTRQVLLVIAVPIGTLAAAGGAYSGATLPILIAAAVAFLASGARVGAGINRRLDWALLALIGAATLQLLPLPAGVVTALSPHRDSLRSSLYLTEVSGLRPLTINPGLTRAGVACLASALLVFWAAREVFGRGGTRIAAGTVAWLGLITVLVTTIQRASAPDLLLWTWKPADAEAQPFGPFVNRNHLATWLLMTASLTAGYLVSHARSLEAQHDSPRLYLRDWLADGRGLVLAGALLAALAGLAATLSRAAILGAIAALCSSAWGSRTARRLSARLATAGLVLLLAFTVWSNRDGLTRKFEGTGSVGRIVIWRETLPVLRDFWTAGTGLGTYGPAMLHYQREARDIYFNQAHSEYLQMAVEGGVFFVLPAAWSVAAGLHLARRRIRDDTRGIVWLRIGAAAGLTGVAVQSLFETGLRVPANALLAAVLAALVVHEPHGR